MEAWKAALRTSEFWVGGIAVVLQFLVSQNLISQGISDFIAGAAVYVAGRLISKLVKPPIVP